MSSTKTPGLVNEGHWTYIAAAVSQGLEEMGAAGRLLPQAIPRGVLHGARRFLDRALVMTGAGLPPDPVVNTADYAMATLALRPFLSPTEQHYEHIANTLGDFRRLLDQLGVERILTGAEREKIVLMSKFFGRLGQTGEMKATSTFWRDGD